MDSFHQCKTKPSTTAPSQPELPSEPELPPMPDEITLPRHVMWAKLVELQQQLAQIRDMPAEYSLDELHLINEYSHVDDCVTVLNRFANTIAALRLDDAQKDKRIAELEGGKA